MAHQGTGHFSHRLSTSAATAFVLAILFGSIAFSQASDTPAHIIVEGREALFMVTPTLGAGDVVLAPVDFVHLLGADFKRIDDHTVSVTSADGRTFNVACTYSDDRFIVPVQSVAQKLGADVDWDRGSRAITLRAKVLMVKVDGGKLSVVTSYPVNFRTGILASPYRAYVDLFGAVLPGQNVSIPVHADGVSSIRSKQMEFNTVRVALDMGSLPKIGLGPGQKSDRIQLALNGPPIAPSINVAPATQVPPPVKVASNVPQASNSSSLPTVPTPASKPSATGSAVTAAVSSSSPAAPMKMSSTPFRITDVEYVPTVGNKAAIVITTQGQSSVAIPRTEQLDSPARFSVDLQGAELALPTSGPKSQLLVTDPVVKSVRWGTMNLRRTVFGRVVLDLSRPADFKVDVAKTGDGLGQTYTITLNDPTEPTAIAVNPPIAPNPGEPVSPIVGNPVTPPIPGPEPDTPAPNPTTAVPVDISHMTIIVDPGHGGHDGGAPGGGDLWEKNMTLQIAKHLRDELTEAGATVIMTRSDDTFIPLPDRSQLGIDNHADLFISVHCDSGNQRNANSGSTVYYHSNNAVCKEIAGDIAARLKESNCGIPSDGTRTDYVRFPGIGFSVLRRSPEPAVLVECGYINNDADAQALQQDATQDLIAKSIVAGVKDYVANRVARN